MLTHVSKCREQTADDHDHNVVLGEHEDVLEVVPESPDKQQCQDEECRGHAEHVEEIEAHDLMWCEGVNVLIDFNCGASV